MPQAMKQTMCASVSLFANLCILHFFHQQNVLLHIGCLSSLLLADVLQPGLEQSIGCVCPRGTRTKSIEDQQQANRDIQSFQWRVLHRFCAVALFHLSFSVPVCNSTLKRHCDCNSCLAVNFDSLAHFRVLCCNLGWKHNCCVSKTKSCAFSTAAMLQLCECFCQFESKCKCCVLKIACLFASMTVWSHAPAHFCH